MPHTDDAAAADMTSAGETSATQSSGTPTASQGWRSNLWVAACTTIANVAAYGFNILLSRPLGPKYFGELGSLLAVYLLIQVPGTSMQALVARRIASRTAPEQGSDARAVVLDSAKIGAGLALFLAVISPALHAFLGVESWWALVWLVLVAVPITTSFALVGLLQGQLRFFALGLLVLSVQIARVAAALIARFTHPSVASALAWSFVLIFIVTAATALWVTLGEQPGRTRIPNLVRILARDCASVLSVLALSNIDILLARHYLSHDNSGQYAAGNLISKAAFWAPAFIATVAYPRLSRAEERHATLRKSALLCLGLGAVIVAAVAIGAPLTPVLLGSQYKPVVGIAWIFALQGAALAAVLLGVYASIAVHDRRLTWTCWATMAIECTLIATVAHHTPAQVISTVSIGSMLLMLVAVALERKVLLTRTVDVLPEPVVIAGE